MELNNVVIHGNLTRDPELRRIPSSDQNVCNLSLAVNHRHKNRAGQQSEEVYFFDVECWGRTAEVVAQHLKKGRGIVIVGRLKQHRWEAPDGQGNRSRVYIVAESVQFMPIGQAAPTPDQGAQAGPPAGEINFDA